MHDPGRATPPIPDQARAAMGNKRLTSVPDQLPAAGCTTRPFGLSITMMGVVLVDDASGIGSAAAGRPGNGTVRAITSPALTRWLGIADRMGADGDLAGQIRALSEIAKVRQDVREHAVEPSAPARRQRQIARRGVDGSTACSRNVLRPFAISAQALILAGEGRHRRPYDPRSQHRVNAGDVIALTVACRRRPSRSPSNPARRRLRGRRHIVIDNPKGLVVHPAAVTGPARWSTRLLPIAARACPVSRGRASGIVHRLDKDNHRSDGGRQDRPRHQS